MYAEPGLNDSFQMRRGAWTREGNGDEKLPIIWTDVTS